MENSKKNPASFPRFPKKITLFAKWSQDEFGMNFKVLVM